MTKAEGLCPACRAFLLDHSQPDPLLELLDHRYVIVRVDLDERWIRCIPIDNPQASFRDTVAMLAVASPNVLIRIRRI